MGFDIVRHNIFRYCGIEGLGGTGGPQGMLVEKNLFEWIGWQDAASMSESGGTKMHTAHDLLFRNNVVRHIRHANGIWLDIGNGNERITGNVFADIPGNVNPHGIHIEGSNELNEIDNNIFRSHRRDSHPRHESRDRCVQPVSGLQSMRRFESGFNGPRPIGGHTNDVHNLTVYGNIFFKPGRSAIEFTNKRNDTDWNVYPASASPFGGRGGGGPFLRVKSPEPQEWHNLESMREEYGWDKNGVMATIDATFDPDKLELTLSMKGEVKPGPVYKSIDTDFFGHAVNGDRVPGPFADILTAGRTSQSRSETITATQTIKAPRRQTPRRFLLTEISLPG